MLSFVLKPMHYTTIQVQVSPCLLLMITCLLIIIFIIAVRLDESEILISMETADYFGFKDEFIVENCDIKCRFKRSADEEADGLWYHGPSVCFNKAISRNYSNKPMIVTSYESDSYYPCMRDREFLAPFDIVNTVKKNATIQHLYLTKEQIRSIMKVNNEGVSKKKRRPQVAMVVSNCKSLSGREKIMHQLKYYGIKVDSYGGCLNNMKLLEMEVNPETIFKDYMFCVAMENSIDDSYVTEKVYNALAAGCLPIYYGARDVDEFIPSPKSILNFAEIRDGVEGLAKEIKSLINDPIKYEKKYFSWKENREELSEKWKELVAKVNENDKSDLCKICILIHENKNKRSSPP